VYYYQVHRIASICTGGKTQDTTSPEVCARIVTCVCKPDITDTPVCQEASWEYEEYKVEGNCKLLEIHAKIKKVSGGENMEKRMRRILKRIMLWGFSMFIFLFAGYGIPEIKISQIEEALKYQEEGLRRIKVEGKIYKTKRWYKHIVTEGIGKLIREKEFSTREKEFIFIRKGNKFYWQFTYLNSVGGVEKGSKGIFIWAPEKRIDIGISPNSSPSVIIHKNEKDFYHVFSERNIFVPYGFILEALEYKRNLWKVLPDENKNFLVIQKVEKKFDPERIFTFTLYLDRNKSFSLIKWIYKVEVLNFKKNEDIKGRMSELHWENLQKFDNGVWFPKQGYYVNYLITKNGNKKLDREIKFEVEKVSIGGEFKDSLFTLEGLNLPPSTSVIDEIKGIEYKLGEK